MVGVCRIGDANDAGGVITTSPQVTVFAEGSIVAVTGSIGTDHPPFPGQIVPPCPLPGNPHCMGIWQTVGGTTTVFISGLPVVRMGDTDTCGHVRVGGASTVFVGG